MNILKAHSFLYILVTLPLLVNFNNINYESIDSINKQQKILLIEENLNKLKNETQLNTDSSKTLILRTLILSESVSYENGIVEGNLLLSHYYSLNYKTDSSIIALKKAYQKGIKINYEKYFPYVGYSLADKCWEAGNYYEALEYALLLKKYYEEEKHTQGTTYLYNILGLIYTRLSDFQTAIDYFKLAINIAESSNNQAMVGIINSNLGNCFLKSNDYENAIKHYNIGIKLEESNNLIQNVGRSYESVARIYLALNDTLKTHESLRKALQYNNQINDINGLCRTYVTFGELYRTLGNYLTAVGYLEKAEELATKSGLLDYRMSACEQLANVHEKLGNIEKAHKYQIAYIGLYKSIFNVQGVTDTKKLEYELKVAEKQNELNKIINSKQRTTLILSFFLATLFLLMNFLLIVLYIRTKKSRKALMELNSQIQNQNINLENINNELLTTRDQLEKANKLKSHFLRNITHEIRTPLNGIIGLSELMMLETTSRDKKDAYLNSIKESSQRLINTIESLVDMANITTRQLKPKFSDIELNSFINKMLAEQQELNQFTKSRVKIDFHPHQRELVIRSDRDLLKKILFHLLGNSLKFTEFGSITIMVESTSNEAIISINDTGIGISEENYQMVFDVFRQEQEEITKDYSGIGLGLSVSKGLADILGAKLTLKSKKGVGTNFYISIPIITNQQING